MALSFVQKCHRRRIGVQTKPVFTARRGVATTVHNINNCEAAKITTLSNGVRLAAENTDGELVSLSVVIGSGSAQEHNQKNGVANLLQTAAVKNASEQARKLGAVLEGNTTRARTTFTLTVLPNKVQEAVSILGEVVQSNISSNALESARSQVISDRRALWDVVNEEVVMDFFHHTAYQGTQYQTAAGGEIKTLKQLQTADLEAYKAENYVGSNIVLAAAGKVDHAKLESAVESSFSGVSKSNRGLLGNARVPFTGAMMHVRDDTVHQIQVAIGYETFAITNKHAVTLSLLKHLVGSWCNTSAVGKNSSSRLAETIACESLADNFHPFLELYRDTGFFGVYAQTHSTDKLDDLVYEIFNEYQKLLTYLSPEEMTRAKNALKADLLAKVDTTKGHSLSLGASVSSVDRALSLAEAFYRVDLITPGDVKEVIDTYFYDVDPVVVAHGNLEEMPDYVVMRGWTYWNRW